MTRPVILPTALAAVAAAALLSALGTFGVLAEGDTHATREYLVVLAIIGVAALAVFGWAVPRALASPAVGWTAVVLGGLALVSVAAFWSGLPPVLAAGALILGWAQHETSRAESRSRSAHSRSSPISSSGSATRGAGSSGARSREASLPARP
jgi:uncharacterized membrane protein YgcG